MRARAAGMAVRCPGALAAEKKGEQCTCSALRLGRILRQAAHPLNDRDSSKRRYTGQGKFIDVDGTKVYLVGDARRLVLIVRPSR